MSELRFDGKSMVADNLDAVMDTTDPQVCGLDMPTT
jgi:hypothetical protein